MFISTPSFFTLLTISPEMTCIHCRSACPASCVHSLHIFTEFDVRKFFLRRLHIFIAKHNTCKHNGPFAAASVSPVCTPAGVSCPYNPPKVYTVLDEIYKKFFLIRNIEHQEEGGYSYCPSDLSAVLRLIFQCCVKSKK